MDGNGRLSNITSRGGGFANFGGRSDGHGCFPHWALFEGCEGRLVAGVEMKAYVAGESPKTMTVETSDGKKGPWRPVASLSADAAWGEDVPWARVSEPDPAVKHWSWAPMKLGRYLRLTFTSSFNGDAPTMYHTFFYPPMERTGTVADVLRWRLAADRKLVRETEARLEEARKRVRETEARLAALASQAEQEMREVAPEPEGEPQPEAWYGEQEPTVEGVVFAPETES